MGRVELDNFLPEDSAIGVTKFLDKLAGKTIDNLPVLFGKSFVAFFGEMP